MSIERHESAILHQFRAQSAIRLDIVRAARNQGAPSGYLTPMIEAARREAQEVADGKRGELHTAALEQLFDLWAEEGHGLQSNLRTLAHQAAIRLDVVRSAQERNTPRSFQREVVRQAREALEALVKDEGSHPELRKAAAFHLAELQTEAGKFFAARRALKLAEGTSISPTQVKSITATIEEGIKQARLLREFRQLRVESSATKRIGLKSAVALADRMDAFVQRAEATSANNGLAADLARAEQGRWLIDAAKKAVKKGDKRQAERLANEGLSSVSRVLGSTNAHVVARAQFDSARAHLLLANLSGSSKHIETARMHSSAITKRLAVSSLSNDTAINRSQLRSVRQQITVSEQWLGKRPRNIVRAFWLRFNTPVMERLQTRRLPKGIRTLAATCLLVSSAMNLGGIPMDHLKPASAGLNAASQQAALNAKNEARIRAQLVTDEQAKLAALYAQREAEQQQLDAANTDYLAKKQAEDSATGPEAAAKAVREAKVNNPALAVAVAGAESSYGASKFSGWNDAQGTEHVRVEPNGTVGIGLFQVSVPAEDYFAQTPYVVRLENDLAFNASEAEKNHIGPNGGRFTSFCAAYTPGHCMEAAYYLAPRAPALRFLGEAQWAVASEQAKYDAEMAAKAQVDADQKQLDDLDAQIAQERMVLRQEMRDTIL